MKTIALALAAMTASPGCTLLGAGIGAIDTSKTNAELALDAEQQQARTGAPVVPRRHSVAKGALRGALIGFTLDVVVSFGLLGLEGPPRL